MHPTAKRIADVPAFRRMLWRLFNYDHDTGDFTWKINKGSAKAGQVAGTISPGESGKLYMGVMINRQKWMLHRLVFIYVHGIDPPDEVRHLDNDGLNNALSNLELVTRQDTTKNQRLRSDNKSGHCGVLKVRSRYQVRIKTDSGRRHYGSYTTLEEAADVYERVKLENDYHPAHGLPR